MKHVLLLNLHQKYEGIANGNLTRDILKEAKSFFLNHGYEVKETTIDEGYDVAEELEKFKWADLFFVQSPVYWMGLPWLGKKYIDDIFSGGTGAVTYASDGRSRNDPSKTYGSGGLMGEKRYMLSFTYNCPESEFDNPDGFFDGLSLDQANIALHKTFQFCGVKPYPSFSVHDIYKSEFDLDTALHNLHSHLEQNLH
ncbi:MAG: NAD(P)H-dependent oxidoreductase [Sulfuricurvum sp.]|uniref:NAD(P)H-dependent oxidoreductase n=1 Tax=Sulfuricurvum sp. TaxID=2025608 RepID=UPI00263A038F|nr:NAD(P)H-dependent oxidoreductase [uncultured Sulfuricurvum sp.]MDD2837773.1 NAD(P)H-dependent oxidoreductase [Sulfuricurvum sp.]